MGGSCLVCGQIDPFVWRRKKKEMMIHDFQCLGHCWNRYILTGGMTWKVIPGSWSSITYMWIIHKCCVTVIGTLSSNSHFIILVLSYLQNVPFCQTLPKPFVIRPRVARILLYKCLLLLHVESNENSIHRIVPNSLYRYCSSTSLTWETFGQTTSSNTVDQNNHLRLPIAVLIITQQSDAR